MSGAMPSLPIWQNHRFVTTLCGENTPFVFDGKLYLLQNIPLSCLCGRRPCWHCHEDYAQIREVDSDQVISHLMVNTYFSAGQVFNGEMWVYATGSGFMLSGCSRHEIYCSHSQDLFSWSKPEVVLQSEDPEQLFNTSVVFDGRRYVMIYESNDSRYVPFTFKFAVSDDLRHWEKLPDEQALYGARKYVGGPFMYFVDGWYYVTYVNCVDERAPNSDYCCYYDTRIARSRDLSTWEEGKFAVLEPDFQHETDPDRYPTIRERNASDAEFVEWQGKALVYWNGGNQLGVCDLQSAEYPGTLAQLFARYF